MRRGDGRPAVRFRWQDPSRRRRRRRRLDDDEGVGKGKSPGPRKRAGKPRKRPAEESSDDWDNDSSGDDKTGVADEKAKPRKKASKKAVKKSKKTSRRARDSSDGRARKKSKNSKKRRDRSSSYSSSSGSSSSSSEDSEWEEYFSNGTVAKVRKLLEAGLPEPPREVMKGYGNVAFDDRGDVLFVRKPSGRKERWMKESRWKRSERYAEYTGSIWRLGHTGGDGVLRRSFLACVEP
jgi:hypothetical protein